MKYIIDTHIIIWRTNEPEKLSNKITSIIDNVDNTIYISFASIWEMSIKINLNKLKLGIDINTYLEKLLIQPNFKILPIYLKDILQQEQLPLHHKDPFDRMLIAQSINTKYPIITTDKYIKDYKIKIIS